MSIEYRTITTDDAKLLHKQGGQIEYYDNRKDNVFDGWLPITSLTFWFSYNYHYRTPNKKDN